MDGRIQQRMTPAEAIRLMRAYGLRLRDVAVLSGCHERQVRVWLDEHPVLEAGAPAR